MIAIADVQAEPLIDHLVRKVVENQAVGVPSFYGLQPLNLTEADLAGIRQVLLQIPEVATEQPITVRDRISPRHLFYITPTTIVRNLRTSTPLLRSIYQDLVQMLLIQNEKIQADPVWAHLLGNEAWIRGGPEDWRRLYEGALELRSGLSSTTQLALIQLGDILYAPGNTLLQFIRSFGIDWRSVLIEIAREQPSFGAGALVTAALERLQQMVAERQQQQFGPTSQLTREATDDFDRRRGLLTAGCDAWTYSELEFWSRWQAQTADLQTVLRWFVDAHSEQGLDVNIEGELDRKSLLEVVRPFIETAAKRYLCALLLATGFQAPTSGRESFTWHGADLLPGYLDARGLELLSREQLTRSTSVPHPARRMPDVLQSVADQLVGQLSENIKLFRVEIEPITPVDPRSVDVYSGGVLALIGLNGSVVVSLISRRSLPPLRVVVESGGLLLIDEWIRGSYNQIVIRQGEGGGTVLVLSYQP